MPNSADLLAKLPEVPTGPSREIRGLAAQLLGRDPDLTWETAVQRATDQLATQAAQREEAEVRTQTCVASFQRLTGWGCCGAPAVGNQDGLCGDCRVVVVQVRSERLASELVDGHTRRQLAESYVTRRLESLQAS